jgi:cytochrome c5
MPLAMPADHKVGAVAAAVAGTLIAAIASAQGNAQKTVLDGVFTAAQADRGGIVYGAECAACHEGADVDGPPLTGAPFIDRWREDTLDGLFEFVKARMPQQAPGSLSDRAYLDILGHLLQENSFPAGPRELTLDALASTTFVGPDGPRPLPNGALVSVVGCLSQSPSREWTISRAGRASRAREGNEITPAETAAAAGTGPGTQTFALQNVGAGGTALPGNGAEGQKVVVKGALTQRAGGGRIHVTAAASVAGSCN